jgi:hypothetical protein
VIPRRSSEVVRSAELTRYRMIPAFSDVRTPGGRMCAPHGCGAPLNARLEPSQKSFHPRHGISIFPRMFAIRNFYS